MQPTIIQYYGEQNRSRCGYCRNCNTSNSHGMHGYIMTPQDYQDLIDRGWRRSGEYCYKPNMRTTCCPCYTIRCDVHEFKLSKSQKKVLKRMSRFLQNGLREKGEEVGASEEVTKPAAVDVEQEEASGNGEDDSLLREEPDIPKVKLADIDINGVQDKNPLATTEMAPSNGTAVSTVQQGEKRRDTEKSLSSLESNRPPCKKAKQMRIERRQAKLAAKGLTADNASQQPSKSSQNSEKGLNDYFEEVIENPRHTLTVRIVPSNKGVTKPVVDLYRKYQCAVHKDPPHKTTVKSFERFLVRTPLQYVKTPDGPETGYGSFHQQYWLDDRLIAVGVIDILPLCVSSVYFFYDPDYNFLSLGTYGSLRELYLTNQLAKRTPALKYYYMGFYIHSCPKMIYKGRLSGSYLLCPEVYSWHRLVDGIRKKLDESKYQRLNDDPNAKDAEEFTEGDLDLVLIMYDRNSHMTYRNYVQALGLDFTRDAILEYGQLVGRRCAHRMLYVKI